MEIYFSIILSYHLSDFLVNEVGGIMEKTVIELFAGVGGFRVGLNNIKDFDENGRAIENGPFKFLWANQWEPESTIQHAFNCYKTRFSDTQDDSNTDITKVDKYGIRDHTLLVGGFPCQDYSVARSLANEKGIEGKKGVLWWQIRDILVAKKPPFVLLENVDRLLKSPAKQRGRDFGIMLRCFNDLGYGVEWRVINAAEYGHPQRRRRVYIFAFRSNTHYYGLIRKRKPLLVLSNTGIFAKSFKVNPLADKDLKAKNIDQDCFDDLVTMSNLFRFDFMNSGLCINHIAYTANTVAKKQGAIALRKIIQANNVPESFYLTPQAIEKFKYLKGSKKINRTSKEGHDYIYSEGKISFPDYLNRPGRTMLTSEGTINRSTHVIKDAQNRFRYLTPIETERLNQFPDNWTNTNMPIKKRYFMMGNALVCGVVRKIGRQISEIIDGE